MERVDDKIYGACDDLPMQAYQLQNPQLVVKNFIYELVYHQTLWAP